MYKINFNNYQRRIFNKMDFNGDKRNKLMSVFSYVIKYCDKDGLTKSVTKLHKAYLHHHRKISLSYFKKLVRILIDFNLLVKENKVVNVFKQKGAEKGADKKQLPNIDTSNLENHLKNPKFKGFNYNTNTSIEKISDLIKSLYKGINPSKYASKKELIKIAKAYIIDYKITEASIQKKIFSKIYNSKQKINTVGAPYYIEKLVLDKLSEYDSNTINQSKVNLENSLCINI